MSTPLRILIYARGEADEIRGQQRTCRRIADRLGREVVSLASDPPDGSSGWTSANALISTGEVDRILVASRNVIPNVVESVTMALPGRRPRRVTAGE
jgi:hypothetical protein